MQNQCGTSNGRGGANPQSRRRAPSFPLPLSPFALQPSRRRRAVTLIELLITMTIMAIISAAILGTAAAAIESSREKKTQSLITKIHTLLMERYAQYETRRVDVDSRIIQALDQWVASAPAGQYQARSAARGQMLADARLLGIRELMKKEMPDRQVDVTHVPLVLTRSPQLAQTYFRRYQQLPSGASLSPAECLYLVIMNATGDGEARTLFSKQDIGDVDEDGAPEFLDGWGNSIGWIRWPAGVVSSLQPLNPDGTRPGESDHDPLDLFRRDSPAVINPPVSSYPAVGAGPNNVSFQTTYNVNLRQRMGQASPAKSHLLAYRLVPLVYSGGPDGESAMRYAGDSTDEPLNPYYVSPDNFQSGAIDSSKPNATKDNITNHDIQY